MKPAPFEYFAPRSVEETLSLLAEHGDDAKLLAGGQSLVPTMNFRLAQPAVLVDINRIDELAFIRTGESPDAGADSATGDASAGAGDILTIGAMMRQSALERSAEVARQAPLLAAALPHVAHPQIRNRGTIGGSLAHADPAAELPAVAVALGARIVVRNGDGERRYDAANFFEGLFTTALAPDDLLAAVELPPLQQDTGWSFQEVARRHGDFALVGVAATVQRAGERCAAARIVLFAVGGAPVVAAGAAELLRDAGLTDARIAEAARCAAHDDIDPFGDIHASAAYKRHLAEVLVRRALHEAAARAAAGRSAPR